MENPANNTTTPGDPSFLWKPEPTQRGTFGIFSFCFSTLIICVWSALHFDITPTRVPPTNRFFIQVICMVIALIAPEVLLWAAINQRVDSESLMRRVLEYLPQNSGKPGMFARLFRAKSEAVSTQHQLEDVSTPKPPHSGSNSLDFAGAP